MYNKRIVLMIFLRMIARDILIVLYHCMCGALGLLFVVGVSAGFILFIAWLAKCGLTWLITAISVVFAVALLLFLITVLIYFVVQWIKCTYKNAKDVCLKV